MKKPSYLLLLLFVLLPLLAMGQTRSVSVNSSGILVAPADLFTINSNALDTAISRDVLGNVNTATLRSGASTNTGPARFEGGFTVTGIATNQNVRIPGWQSVSGPATNDFMLINTALFSNGLTNSGPTVLDGILTANQLATFNNDVTFAVGSIVSINGTTTWADDVRHTFNPGANAAGINVGSHAGDPGTPVNGDLVYNSSLNTVRARINGAWVSWGTGGGGGDDKIATNNGTGWFTRLNWPTNENRATFLGPVADRATNLTHATHNEFVMEGPRFARMSMGADMTVGFVPPSSATDVGMIGRLRVLSTAGNITFSNITARGPIGMNVGTNMFYFHWDGTNYWVEAGQLGTSGSGDFYVLTNAPTINSPNIIGSPTIAGYVPTSRTLEVAGTANEISVSGGTLDLSGNRSWTAALPTTIDLGGKTSFELPNSASPTTDLFGELAGDNNAWAASRGAIQFFDGTANTFLVGVLTTDSPTDLQVPKFNAASGTITWENDNNSGAATALNDIADPSADGVVAMAGFIMSYTSTLNGGAVNTISNTLSDVTSDTSLLDLVYNDNGDPNAIFLRGRHNAGGTLGFSFSSTLFENNLPQTNSSTTLLNGPVGMGNSLSVVGAVSFSTSSNSSTALVSGNAGFGGTVTIAGALAAPYDAATTGSTLKFKNYLYLKGPDLVQNGGMLPNTNDVTAVTFGKVRFSNSADEASNYAEWHIQVPDDFDTSVDPRAKIKYRLTGADTGTHRYVVSMASVADSAAYAGTVGTAINLDDSADASGASGDVETVGFTTLTGWGAAVTQGNHWVIRVARDGNATEDGSTVDSDLSLVVIEYGVTQ